MKMNPAKRQQKLDQARQACNAGDAPGAERLCQALLRDNAGDAQALHLLGIIAASRQDYPAATQHFSRAAAIDARNAQFHKDLARVHALSGRYVDAVASLEGALKLQPGDERALTDLADVLERSGQFPRAQALLDPFMQAGGVSDDMAPILMRLLDHAGQTQQAIDLARQRLAAATSRDERERRFLLQLLGRLLDKAGDYRGAFDAFAAAKQTERHRFVPGDYAREIDALIEAFSPEVMAKLPRASQRSEVPVFIACMPRSGSTLVEQIIHAHPKAHGGGETPLLHQLVVGLANEPGHVPYPQRVATLDAATLDRLAGTYLREVVASAPKALRITNKHLLNYIHLGMVALLFPGARVIHIRRHPLDNALACFMTSLSPQLMPWARDLQHIGFAWQQYERLMAHWRATLGLNLLEVQYEDLVNDTEPQIRRIIDFCGLEWDERCLRFWEADRVVLTPSYDQVRRPIFRSALDRWKRYEEFLGPLKEASGA